MNIFLHEWIYTHVYLHMDLCTCVCVLIYTENTAYADRYLHINTYAHI